MNKSLVVGGFCGAERRSQFYLLQLSMKFEPGDTGHMDDEFNKDYNWMLGNSNVIGH